MISGSGQRRRLSPTDPHQCQTASRMAAAQQPRHPLGMGLALRTGALCTGTGALRTGVLCTDTEALRTGTEALLTGALRTVMGGPVMDPNNESPQY